jgi:L-iditol 2-dehydrogenase
MKALILKDYMQFAYEDFPQPKAGPGEVLVRVGGCGICGSDVHGMDGSTGRRRPPIVMGHEAAGAIVEIGEGVTAWKEGDRVTFDSTVYCGQCPFCRRGFINLCDRRRVLGVSCEEYRWHGAFAEYVAVPERILYRLPDGLSYEHAVMVEPLSIACHAVNRTPRHLNDTALVVGAGMVGLLVIQALKAAGYGSIVAVDVEAEKLALAKKLGATGTIDGGSADAIAAAMDMTGGIGFDASFEVVGLPKTVETAVKTVRKGGTVTLVGNITPRVELPLAWIVTRELSLYGSCASCGEYPACLEMIASGKIDVACMVSAVAPLSEGAQWFNRLYGKEKGLMKVVLQP